MSLSCVRQGSRALQGLLRSQVRCLHAQVPKEELEVAKRVTILPGDGVGPELIQSVQTVLKASGAGVEYDDHFLSEVFTSRNTSYEELKKSIVKNGVCLMPPHKSAMRGQGGELETLNMKLRKELDLYANVVFARTVPGVTVRHKKPIDITIIREHTEGEYSAKEHQSVPGVVECLKIITAEKSRRIAMFAFDYAAKNGRKKVTAVHKANIMKLSDGLFLRCCEEISELYPEIEFDTVIVDNCCMQIVSNPYQYDVLVTPNLYGNILANLCAGMVGGAGLVAAQTHSDSGSVVFEPGARHIFSSGVGKGISNPSAMLFAAANMMEYIGQKDVAERVRFGVYKTLSEKKVRTKDLGGHSTSEMFTNEVVKHLRACTAEGNCSTYVK